MAQLIVVGVLLFVAATVQAQGDRAETQGERPRQQSQGPIRLAQAVDLVMPVFPQNPLEVGDQQPVIMDLFIDSTGRVDHWAPYYSPSEEYTEIAMAALRASKFEPAEFLGQPTRSFLRLAIREYFYLDEELGENVTLPRARWRLGEKTRGRVQVLAQAADNPEIEPKGVMLDVQLDKEGLINEISRRSRDGRPIENYVEFQNESYRFTPLMVGDTPSPAKLVMVFLPYTQLRAGFTSPADVNQNPPAISKWPEKGPDAVRVRAFATFDGVGLLQSFVAEPQTPTGLFLIVADAVSMWLMPPETPNGRVNRIRSFTLQFDFNRGEELAQVQMRDLAEGFQAPQPIKTAAPQTPVQMRGRADGHYALIKFTIKADGEVEDVVVDSYSNKDIGQAAGAAVLKWKFKPATFNGEPVPVRAMQLIDFR